MANSHGKVVASAVVAQLSGLQVNPMPMLTNTCYSFVNDKLVVHVASVHQYVAAEKTYRTVAGSGGVSTAPTELEGIYAWNWAQNIWSDTLL
jgi:sulfide dehydrogenase [flavocytochrome c] flavoprotein chain